MRRPSALRVFAALAIALAVTECSEPSTDHAANRAPACVTCHFAEYRSAPHHANERPTRCEVCHTSEAWSPTVLRHRWPLTGAHARVTCFQCHRGTPPVFEGTSAACVDCHHDDYALRTFPAHASFPTTCEQCHTTAAWTPATFDPRAEAEPVPPTPGPNGHPTLRPNHSPNEREPAPAATHPESRFPIATGHHAGIACRTCHDQGGTMGRNDTDCVQCHPRSRYDGIHISVDGYLRAATAPNFCVDCHRRGTRRRD